MTQPMVRPLAPWATLSHSWVRSRATRSLSFWLKAVVTKGWGSRATSACPWLRRVASSACSVLYSTATWFVRSFSARM